MIPFHPFPPPEPSFLVQYSSNGRQEENENIDYPPEGQDILGIEITASPEPVQGGDGKYCVEGGGGNRGKGVQVCFTNLADYGPAFGKEQVEPVEVEQERYAAAECYCFEVIQQIYRLVPLL